MFKELIQAWTNSDLLHKAYAEAASMLELSNSMYQAVTAYLLDRIPPGIEVYKTDQQINRMQIEVRRKILEHASANKKIDIVGTLVLANLVINIERIGDYNKNIYELAQIYGKSFPDESYHRSLRDKTALVQDMFIYSKDALAKGSIADGEKVITLHNSNKKECDTMIETLIKNSPQFPDAAALVLYTRYLKRISAHLMNLASSITNPYDVIGFAGKGKFDDE